ncbi:hydroxypyruvate isomerase, partial [Pseudomonas sp. MWU12-2534b]
ATIDRNHASIGNAQPADNPGRNGPGAGEINYAFLVALLDRLGYGGYVGCEYKPRTTTTEGLGWLQGIAGCAPGSARRADLVAPLPF